MEKRKKIIEALQQNKIPYGIYYHLPLHLQPANRYLEYKKGQFPVAEKICQEIFALPIHPSLKEDEIKKVIRVIKEVLNG